jgi:outer membrane protein assembly factor BamB
MLRYLLAAVAALSVCSPASVFAAKVKVWHQHTTSQYDKARFTHAVITSEGALRLARQLKPLASLDATHVWDLAEDKDGNLYAATGDEGKVYKVAADGKTTVAHQGEDSQVFCLAVAADGAILAGTGPGGRIVRIDPRGAAKVLCETGESYVWSLAVDAKSGAVYAGTGPKGRVYQITPDGKANVFYQTRQEHVLCLATGSDGTIYAGTDKGGLVYRIDPKGKGFVLFQAAQAEVRSLKATPDGLYVGTSASNRGRGRGTASSSSGNGSSVAALERVAPSAADSQLPLPKEAKPGATSNAPSSESKENSKGSSAPAPSVPSAGENSVYRITADGGVREVFREKALVLSLLRQGGHFFVGTGMEGQLFEVDEATRERSEIARLDNGQILALLQRKDGSIVLGTGDPGKLYVLQDKYAKEGTVLSDVLDAKIISKWGALRWQADVPAGATVTVALRSGNVAEPDETWSDWSAEQTDPERAAVASPPARFLQYRITLKTDNPAATPVLRGLTIRYATANQAPEVTKVEVPDLNAVNLDNPKRLKFKWAATDANEDELTYALYVRKDGWKSWVQLEDDLEKTDYDWDTTTTPSGVYQIKIVASDRKDNPEAEALTGERVSAPFVVSHEPPAVSVKVTGIDGDRVRIEATARSPLVRLTAASFAVNGRKWVNVFPTDGLFDSKEETFRFQTETLKPGTYVLVLRVRDAAGNTGSGDVVFTVKERGVKPGEF